MTKQVKGDRQDLMNYLPAMSNESQTYHCFSSPEAILEYLETIPQSAHWNDEPFSDDWAFTRTHNISEAKDLCRQGWPEGAERVSRMRDKIVATRPMQRRATAYSVAGALPNIPRALAGNVQCFYKNQDTVARQRPVITLVNHMGGRSGVGATTFMNKCATVAAIVDVIEGAGFSCHVIGVSQSINHSTPAYLCGVAVTVKEPSQPVDIGRMAFALGHPSMFRRLVFAVRTSDRDNMPLTSSLGRTTDFENNAPSNTFVLPSMSKNEELFTTEAKAATVGLESLIASLKTQGCPAFREE